MAITDQNAVIKLNGPDTVRDMLLVAVSFENPDDDPTVTMVFQNGAGMAPRTVRLVFREVTDFDFVYSSDYSRDIPMFKCFRMDNGDFYVSLDPYDEREGFASEKDGDVVRAKHIEMVMNPDPQPAA